VATQATTAGATRPVTNRVLGSNLTGQVPEQMAADINAQVRADQVDALLGAITSKGIALSRSLMTNQDTASSTAAKRGIQLHLVNMAQVPAKECDNLVLVVRDVEAAYKAARDLINQPAAVAPGGEAGLRFLPETKGRVINYRLTGQTPTDTSATINAQLRADQAGEVLAALRGAGEVLNSSVTENPELVNVTTLKRGLNLTIVPLAGVNPREVQELHGVAADVPGAFNKLLETLQGMAAAGNARIINSNLSNSDPRSINASLVFEAQRTAVNDVEKAFTAAGIEFPSRRVARSTDTANTLDSKIRFALTDLKPAETLDPKRTITMGLEVDDVDKAVARLKTALAGLDQKVREAEFNVAHDPSGHGSAHIVLDTYVSTTPTVLGDISGLNGRQTSLQETRNGQAPETKSFTRERVDLTLVTSPAIIQSNQSVGSSVRAALSSAGGALIYSLYLVLTGLLFVLPFALIVYPIYRVAKRRKTGV
jgi:hypothetical protein